MPDEKESKAGGVGLPVGSKIGKYEIRQKLGIGGQAIVYKCHDATLDRFVAVKQISTHLAEDPKFLERFRKEAQVLARLGAEQSAIVTIHELIADEHGLFIVMEFVPGRSLEGILAESDGPIEPKATLQILWRLAAALHAVHTAGIIHRDLKPSNILISEGLRPTVTDFGVAASSSGQTSMLLGTTKYMAPELFGGGTVDGRADMYSLGFVAYEMLIGRPRFRKIFSDIVRDRHTEALRWMKWHGNTSVQAPPLHEVNPRVPEVLSNIIARMMAKNLDDRFENMEALGRAIKVSFSVRARAGSAAGAPAVTAPPAPEDIAPGDEGDELEVEPTATAPIPKGALSVRTKLILAGFIALTAIGFGVGMGVRSYLREQARRNSAEGRFETIVRLFDKKDLHAEGDFWEQHDPERNYEEAIEEITALRKLFPDTLQARKASVIVFLCNGHVAVAEKDWQAAARAEDDASERLKEVQRTWKTLNKWCAAFRERIDLFSDYRRALWTLSDVMRRVRSLVAEEKLDEALALIEGEIPSIELPRAQQQEVEQIIRDIRYLKLKTQLVGLIDRADQLYANNDLGGAAAAYQSAMDLLDSDQAILMPRDERNERRQHVRERLLTLKDEGQKANLLAIIAEARKNGDKAEEKRLLEDFIKRWPSDKHVQQIGLLTNEMEFAEAEQAVTDGKEDEALAILKRILRRDPNYPPAVQLEKKLTTAREWTGFVQAGDAAFVAKDYRKALQLYGQAAEIRLEADLKSKMDECGFTMGLAEADKEAAGKNYARAIELYTALGQKYPAKEAVVQARTQGVNRRQQFEGLVSDADEALRQREYAKARRKYKEAGELMPSRAIEVKVKVQKALYFEAIDLGQECLDHNDFDAAIAHFKRALSKAVGKEESDRVQLLILEAERRKKGRLKATE